MRTKKFRGKLKNKDEWAYWNAFGEIIDKTPATSGFYYAYQINHRLLLETVGRYTGIQDANNKPIWEHCECTVTSKTGGTLAYGYIKLIQGCFVFVEYGTHNVMRLCDLEINNLVIKITNDFYDANKVEKDGAK